MVAERLGLWRLSGFELTRLPAAPDVHLFRIQGREVPDDQRLIALADVRDLTIVRDEDGRIRGLPQIERALDACLDSLRSARSADRELARLDWNRVQLYVWPAWNRRRAAHRARAGHPVTGAAHRGAGP